MSETPATFGPSSPHSNPDEEPLPHLLHRWTSSGKPTQTTSPSHLSESLSRRLYAAIRRADEAEVRTILDAAGRDIQTDLVESPNIHPSFSCLQTAAMVGHRGIVRLLWEQVGAGVRFQSFRGLDFQGQSFRGQNCQGPGLNSQGQDFRGQGQGPNLNMNTNIREPYYDHGLMPSCLILAARNGHAQLVGDFLDWYDGWWNRERCMALYDAAAMWRGEVVGVLLERVKYEWEVVQVGLQRAVGLSGRGVWRDCMVGGGPGEMLRPVGGGEDDDGEGELRKVVERLVEAGADLNRVIQDLDAPGGDPRLSRWMTLPIHTAYNRLGLLGTLLEKRADPNLPDEQGRTVLHKVAELFDQPFLEVRRYKGFEHGVVGSAASVSVGGGSSSDRGRGYGRGRYMGRGRGVGRGRGRGRGRGGHHPRRFFLTDRSHLSPIYPLSLAPYIGDRPTKANTQETNLAVLQLLFKYAASPTIADNKGETPLHLLASTGSLEAFRLCLSHCQPQDTDTQAAIHMLNGYGESPLHYAAAAGNEAILSFLLLDQGLDPNLSSDDGWTPFLCALHPVYGKSQAVSHRTARFLLSMSNNPAAMAQVVTKEGWSAMHALATPWDRELLHFCEQGMGKGDGTSKGKHDDSKKGDGEHEENGRGGYAAATTPMHTGKSSANTDFFATEATLISLTQHLLSLGAPLDSRAEWLRYRAADATALYGRWGGRMRTSTISAAGRAIVNDDDDDREELTPLWWARGCEVSAVEDVLERFMEVKEAMERNLEMAKGDMEQMEVSGQIVGEALAMARREREMERKRMPAPVALVQSGVCWPNGEVRY